MSYESATSPRLARLEVDDLDRDGNFLGKPMEAEVSLFFSSRAALIISAPPNVDHPLSCVDHPIALHIAMTACLLFQAQPTPSQ